MLLAIDIGNTDVVIGVHKNGIWVHEWRISSKLGALVKGYRDRLSLFMQQDELHKQQIHRIILSSVVPRLTPVWVQVCESFLGQRPLIMGVDTYSQLAIEIDNPKEIGADLVANAVAAWTRYQDYCIVVDFGTALTFTTVAPPGKILGVAIAPGLKTAMGALFSNTAQLMEVPLEIPETVIGKNTLHALQAGILYGYVGLVKGILVQIEKEVNHSCKVIATGGLSSVLTPLQNTFEAIDRKLTLDGLRIIAEQYE